MARPTVALIATTYYPVSHADIVGTRLIEGYVLDGKPCEPRVEVVSMYLEQLGERIGPSPLPDIGVGICERAGVTMYPTVAEAIGRGKGGVHVDGVVIIGEHGDYEWNEFGQHLYPRRRLFDAAVSTMIAADRFVPVFCDKHLAWSFEDGRAMYETATRLGIPLLAGSSIPLSWRVPTATEWPLGEPMETAVAVGYGNVEAYGFHTLEGLQAHAERRRGGETGVAAVRGVAGAAAVEAVRHGEVDRDLLNRALSAMGLDDAQAERARRSVKSVFFVDYVDGLRAAAIVCGDVVQGFGAACRGPNVEIANEFWLNEKTFDHFSFLARQIEALVLDGAAPYPVERTVLTGGVLDVAMRSLSGDGARRATPELAISYDPPTAVAGTGVPSAKR